MSGMCWVWLHHLKWLSRNASTVLRSNRIKQYLHFLQTANTNPTIIWNFCFYKHCFICHSNIVLKMSILKYSTNLNYLLLTLCDIKIDYLFRWHSKYWACIIFEITVTKTTRLNTQLCYIIWSIFSNTELYQKPKKKSNSNVQNPQVLDL